MFSEQHARPVLGAPAGAGCARPGRLAIGRQASPPAEGGEMDQERPLLAEAWLGVWSWWSMWAKVTVPFLIRYPCLKSIVASIVSSA